MIGACAQAPVGDSYPAEAPAPVPQEASAVQSAAQPVEQAVRQLAVKPATEIHFAAVGDMMLGTDYPEDRLPDDDAVGFLGNVTETLAAADLTFGNLEGVLADDAEPAKQCSNLNACYLFRSPTRYADRFAAAGFDALSLANNHARDFGEDGRTSTMRALAARGIAHSGRAGDFATLTAKGLSISFLAFAVTRESNLMHDYALAADIVADAARNHDLVVVSFHGGAEGAGSSRIPFAEEAYYGEPRGDVVRFSRSMVDAGADLVFGHGPHVVRGMERYRERLIAYSLGNFATYYGISVADSRGVAPILLATLDETGRFLGGQLISTRQVRPDGPAPDPERAALREVRELSRRDLVDTGLRFGDNGRITPAERRFIKPTAAWSESES
ncbi:MAG: CapA family protein [Pseudomonadota bacterium]